MKKKWLTGILALGLCCTMTANTGANMVQAAMNDEEEMAAEEAAAQKREELMDILKELQEKNKHLQGLSDYERLELMTEEQMADCGWDVILQKGDIKYSMQGDRLKCITTKVESVSDIVIPEEVKEIDGEAFYGVNFEPGSKVYIHKDVKEIGYLAFYYLDGVSEIIVDEENEAYCSVDGVLYTKDMKKLIAYPSGKEATIYVMPDTLEEIRTWSFGNVDSLQYIQFGKNICKADEQALTEITYTLDTMFSLCDSLKAIYVPDNEVLAEAVDGKYPHNWTLFLGEMDAQSVVMETKASGDLDGDGVVTLQDAQLALKAALKVTELSEIQIKAAGLTTDEISLENVRSILQTALNVK